MDTAFIRPSILPKLALCGHYRGTETAGPAAERGTRIDGIFRTMIMHPDMEHVGDPDEIAAAEWAVANVRAYAAGAVVDATEEGCSVSVDVEIGRYLTGTGDAVAPTIATSWDLKSGQIRNYLEQQAIYAAGYMDDYFTDTWTVHLVYCDERQVVTYRFTREGCDDIARRALLAWRSKAPPQTNDYCGWCANQFTCDARKAELGQWLAPTGMDQHPSMVLADVPSDKLAAFCVLAKSMEPWTEEARRILRERIDAGGEKSSGVKLVSKRGSRKVAPLSLLDLVEPAVILGKCAPISEADAKELFPDLLENLVIESPGRVEMHISKPKAPKA